jgi:hypothetical protein
MREVRHIQVKMEAAPKVSIFGIKKQHMDTNRTGQKGLPG